MMKRKFFSNLFIVTMVSMTLLAFFSCKKNTPDKQLIDAINKSPIGFKIDKDKGTATVQQTGNRYLITFKDTPMTFDTSAFKSVPGWNQLKAIQIPIICKELTYLYGPKEKYLEMISIKGFTFEMDPSTLMEKKEVQGFPTAFQSKIKMTIDSMSFKNYNVSPLLTYEGKDIMELAGKIMEAAPRNESIIEKIAFEMTFPSKEKKNMSISMEMEKIEGHQLGMSSIFLEIYKKEAPAPDFSKVLQQGLAIFDVTADMSNFKLSVEEEGKELGGGSFAKTSFAYFVKPNETKTSFNYGMNWDLKGLKLNIPDSKLIEQIFNIDEMGMKFSIENLSADFLKSYFGTLKMAMNINEKDKEKTQREMGMTAMTMGGEFIKSKPVIKLSLSPFKSALGEMSGQAEFQFPSIMTPSGFASLKIVKVTDILKKLKESNLIPLESLKNFDQILKKLFIVDKNGDATLTFEMKPDQPGKFLLNGKPTDFGSKSGVEK